MTGSRIYPPKIMARAIEKMLENERQKHRELHFKVGSFVVLKSGRRVGKVLAASRCVGSCEQLIRWINRNGRVQWVRRERLRKASPLHLLAAEAPKEKTKG